MNLTLSAFPKILPPIGGVLTILAPHERIEIVTRIRRAGLQSWHHAYTIQRSQQMPIDWGLVRQELDMIAAYLQEDNPVLIHCSAGIHRTGTNGWAILRRLGFSSYTATQWILNHRPQSADFQRFIPWAEAHLL